MTEKRLRYQNRWPIFLKINTVLATLACDIFTKWLLNRKYTLSAIVFTPIHTYIHDDIIEKQPRMNSGDQKTRWNYNIDGHIHKYVWNHCKNNKNGFREPQNVKAYRYFHNWMCIMITILSLYSMYTESKYDIIMFVLFVIFYFLLIL